MTDIAAGPSTERSRGEAFLHALRFLLAVLRARPLFALGYIIVLIVIVLAIFAPWIAPYEPEVANPPIELPADYDVVRDRLLREVELRQSAG